MDVNILFTDILISTIVLTSNTAVQDATDPWDSTESTFVNNIASNDPWGSTESTFVNNTSSDDPWAPWNSTTAAAANTANSDDPWASPANINSSVVNNIDSNDPWAAWTTADSAAVNNTSRNDPWANTSSALISEANSDFVRGQAQSTASVTTAPSYPTERHFTGINSDRLAMLDAGEEPEEEIVQQPIAGKGKGENAVELPFNRLAMLNKKKTSEIVNGNMNEESEISEEE